MVITLPATLNVGDTVRVSGESVNRWALAQNAGQTVATTNLPGNTVPGAVWTTHDTPRHWWFTASSADGNKLAAVDNPGFIYTSDDGGETWTPRPISAGPQNWAKIAMTPDGTTLAAVSIAVPGAGGHAGGQIYTSSNGGVDWIARDQDREWVSVAVSADGLKMVATVINGNIYTSTDAGATWKPHLTIGETTATGRVWRAVASSSDGNKLVAVASSGHIYTSIDAGLNWTERSTPATQFTAAETATGRNWYRVTSSADGSKLAAADNGGLIYVSNDSGKTWTAPQPAFFAAYHGIASTADGDKLAWIVPNVTGETNANIWLSNDAGVTSKAVEKARQWRGIAMSADGNRLVAAENGGDAFGSGLVGLIYTSRGNRTATGTLGSITGGQGDSIQVQYLGNGQFKVLNSSTLPFVIK